MNTVRPILLGLVAVALVGCASTASQSPGATGSALAAATGTPAAATATPTEAASGPAGTPTASFALPHNATELEALLPDRIGADTLTKFSWSGPDFIKTANSDNAELVAWLQALGKSLNDVSAAGAFDISTSGSGGTILAFRVNGVDHSTLLSSLQTAIAKGMDTPPTWTAATVGGKSVQQAPTDSSGETQYLYGVADIVFIVVAKDQAWATEALSKLP